MNQGRRIAVGLTIATVLTSMQALILVALNARDVPPIDTKRSPKQIRVRRPSTKDVSPPPPHSQPLPTRTSTRVSPAPMAKAAAVLPKLQLASLTAPALGLPGLGVGKLGLGNDAGDLANVDRDVADGVKETTSAQPLSRPPPTYPRRARERRLEGEVLVRLRVEKNGRVSEAVVVRAEPPGVFDSAALAAARRYRFRPALQAGRPTSTTLEQRIVFRLPR